MLADQVIICIMGWALFDTLSAENLFTVVKSFHSNSQSKQYVNPSSEPCFHLRESKGLKGFHLLGDNLGNRKCRLSDIMQPVERTLLIFDYY